MRPLFIVLAASLTGCALDSSTPVPYSVGQLWTAQDKSESVLISYRSVEFLQRTNWGHNPCCAKII